jgi:hypothetical protein
MVTFSREPIEGTPSTVRTNGFHSGYLAKSRSTLQTRSGDAGISIEVVITCRTWRLTIYLASIRRVDPAERAAFVTPDLAASMRHSARAIAPCAVDTGDGSNRQQFGEFRIPLDTRDQKHRAQRLRRGRGLPIFARLQYVALRGQQRPGEPPFRQRQRTVLSSSLCERLPALSIRDAFDERTNRGFQGALRVS